VVRPLAKMAGSTVTVLCSNLLLNWGPHILVQCVAVNIFTCHIKGTENLFHHITEKCHT